jgi:hypothetical protein
MLRDGALAGADLGDVITRLRIDSGKDALDDAWVVQEVLAEPLPGAVVQDVVLVFMNQVGQL